MAPTCTTSRAKGLGQGTDLWRHQWDVWTAPKVNKFPDDWGMITQADIVVVGVDGSDDSLAALAWGCALAGSNGAVHVVCATSGTEPAPRSLHELENVWTAPAHAAGVSITCHFPEGRASAMVVEMANIVGAQMIVVGGHGASPHRPKMVGSTTHRLLHHSDRPVGVVRSGHVPPLAPGGTAVVGVGNGPATGAALDWTMAFAASRKLSVVLIHAVHHEPRFLFYGPVFSMDQAMEKVAYFLDRDELRQWAEDDLTELAGRLRARPDAVGPQTERGGRPGEHQSEAAERSPNVAAGVNITGTATLGRPGSVLVEAAADAAVMVMGKHYDGPFSGYFTTATLHHVLTHAQCPVVVVAQKHGGD